MPQPWSSVPTGELDERVGQAPGTGAVIADPGATAERFNGNPDGGPAHRVEESAEGDPAVLAASHVEAPVLDRGDLLGEHPGGVAGVAGVSAVKGEAAHRVLDGEGKQGTLLEAWWAGAGHARSGVAGAGRARRSVAAGSAIHGGPERGGAQGPGGAGEQGEVGETDPPRLERGHARGERLRLLAGGDGTRRGVPGHPALMADPVDRRGRALGLVLLRGGEDRRFSGEAELEQIDAVAEPDQALAELGRGELDRGTCHECFDGLQQPFEARSVAATITHTCSIEHAFAATQRPPVHGPDP